MGCACSRRTHKKPAHGFLTSTEGNSFDRGASSGEAIAPKKQRAPSGALLSFSRSRNGRLLLLWISAASFASLFAIWVHKTHDKRLFERGLPFIRCYGDNRNLVRLRVTFLFFYVAPERSCPGNPAQAGEQGGSFLREQKRPMPVSTVSIFHSGLSRPGSFNGRLCSRYVSPTLRQCDSAVPGDWFLRREQKRPMPVSTVSIFPVGLSRSGSFNGRLCSRYGSPTLRQCGSAVPGDWFLRREQKRPMPVSTVSIFPVGLSRPGSFNGRLCSRYAC